MHKNKILFYFKDKNKIFDKKIVLPKNISNNKNSIIHIRYQLFF